MGGMSLDLKLALGGSGETQAGGGASAGYGSDLLLGVGNFASSDGWSMSGIAQPVISGGRLNATGEGGAACGLAGSPLVDGRCYEITFTIVSISNGAVSLALGGATGMALFLTSGPQAIRVVTPVAGTSQTFGFDFSPDCDAVIDNVVIREPLLLGPEICGNGMFDDASGWTLTGAGSVIAGGVYSATAVSAVRDATRAAGATLPSAACFRVTFTIANRTAGNGAILVGGATTGNVGANGTFTRDVQTNATNQNIVVRIGTNGAMAIDNVSVKKIL